MADGVRAVDHGGTSVFVRGCQQGGQKAVGVLGRGAGSKIDAEKFGQGSEKIGEVDCGGGGFVSTDIARPLGDERHAVAAFIDAGFAAAQRASAMVVFCGHKAGGVRAGAVVAGEDEQGVLVESCVLQGLIDLADNIVELHDKISVITVAAFAFECFAWNPGAVGDGGGVIEEEGLLGLRVRVVFDEFDGLLTEGGAGLVEFKVGRLEAFDG